MVLLVAPLRFNNRAVSSTTNGCKVLKGDLDDDGETAKRNKKPGVKATQKTPIANTLFRSGELLLIQLLAYTLTFVTLITN